MNIWGLFWILGSIVFAVVGGVWWLVTGHPPKELLYVYFSFCGVCALSPIEEYIHDRLKEIKETASTVTGINEQLREIADRLQAIERKVG
jgi:hypothetical protein